VVDGWLIAVLSAATREANPAPAALVREMFLANDARTYALHCLALRDGSVRSDQRTIGCPTLLTVGDQDLVMPLGWQQRIAAGIPNSRIRIIPHAHDHAGSTCRVNTVAMDFLAMLEVRGQEPTT
jgi:pimeloyl-ACP methyl ester carboxylesterase